MASDYIKWVTYTVITFINYYCSCSKAYLSKLAMFLASLVSAVAVVLDRLNFDLVLIQSFEFDSVLVENFDSVPVVENPHFVEIFPRCLAPLLSRCRRCKI